MKNHIYIKKLEILECECCTPKDLIRVNNIDLKVDRQHSLSLIEGHSYDLFLDITRGQTDYEGYEYFLLEHEPILDELNECYDFLIEGIISKSDFDIMIDDKVGIFESETDHGHDCYQIIGQSQDEYLVSNGIYFYIGKNRGTTNGKFFIAYCERPYLCQAIKS